MKILRIIFLFVLINVFGTLFASVDGDNWWNETQISTEGKEFYLTFMQNYGKNVGAEDLVLTLYATSHYDTYVTVDGIWTDEEDASISYPWDTTFFVSRNSYGSVIIPSQVAYLDKPKSENAENLNKGIRVISDNYITLYSSSTNTNSYDATIVYPSTTYHREYVIQTYPTDNQSNEFAIVSVADNNKVTITVKEVDFNKGSSKIPVEREIVVLLNRGQSYLYQPVKKEISLIGSTICSEYPITVVQGGQHAKVPQGNSETSHIYNNTLPTKAWGKRHIVTRTAEQRYDYISLLASEDGTKVYRNNSLIAEIDSKEAFRDTIDWNLFSSGSVYYYTSKSTECFIFQSANKSSQGAPTMTDIAPLESAIQRVIFACFDYRYTSEDIYDIDNHYVNIVLPKSCIGGMTIDGKAIHPKDFKDVPYLVDGIGYSYTCQKISKGSHELKNTMGGFVAHVYGQGNVEDVGEITYSYSAGRNILPAAWMLIDGKRTNRKEICEGDPPIEFTSIINYDYTNVRWEFYDLNGDVKVVESSKTASGDSVVSKTYFDIPRGATLEEHIDSVFMIVSRQTPICNYTIVDTVKAVIQVRDTFMIDENSEYGYNENVCYGDTIHLHYNGQDIVIPADTIHSYKYGDKWFKFQLNDSISFVDSLKTNNSCDTCLHCDSIINQIRIIRPTYDTLLYDTTCVNKLPYIWLDKNGNLIDNLDLSEEEKKTLYLTKEHTFASKQIKDTVMMSTQYGCDSLVRIQLTVLPVYHFEDYATVCVDSLRGYTWMGHTGNGKTVYLDGQTPKTYIPLNQDGTFVYVDSLKTKGCKNCELASEGCDSIWTLHLTVLPRSINEEFETICSDHYVVWQDSLWILGWDFLESEVPDGQAYTKLYQSYKKFEVNYKTKDEFEYDSTVILHLFIKSVSRLDTTYYLCKGETYVDADFIDITATNDTSFVKRLTGANAVGCDSVVYVTVKFGENYDVDDSSVVLCERDSMYIWEYQDSYGSYSDTLKWSDLHEQVLDTILYDTLHTASPFYCDSVVSKRVVVNPTVYYEHSETICPTQAPYSDWGNRDESITASGTYTHYINGGSLRYGCDSIEILHLTISDSIVTRIDTTICSNVLPYYHGTASATPNLDNLTTSGVYRQILTAQSGCDSTIVLTLTINDTTVLDTTYYLCKGETYVDADFIDITATNDTSFVKRLTGANAVGCDSVVYVTVKFGENYDVDDSSVVLCERDSMYIWEYQDSYGSYSDTLKWSDLHEQVLDTILYDTLHTASPFYCDSVVSKRVVVNPTTYNKFKTVWCASAGPYTYGEKGKTATTSGIYIDTLITKNQYNCDSVVEVNLTIVDSILINLYDTVCDNDLPYNHSDTRAERLLNLTKTGVYTDTLQSINGCDSVLVLHLQVNETYESTDTIFICASDANPYQWHTTDRNGVHVMDIPFTPDFTINQANKVPFVVGDSSIMLESQFGCDSLVHLHLVVQPTYLFVENDTLCQLAGGNYEWIRHERDIYSETLQQRVSQISLDNDGDFVYIDSLKTHVCDQCPDAGCDSIYQLHLKVLPTYTLIDTVVKISDEETFKWHENGLVYGGASTRETYDVLIPTCYPDTFKTQVTYPTVPVGSYTCDSVRELKIVVGKVTRDTTVDETCSNLEYAWLGKDRFGNDSVRMLITNPETKIYTDVYTTSLGFDSIFYLDLTVHPAYVGIDTMKVYEATCQNSDYTWIRENNHGFPTRLYNLDTKLWIDANEIPTGIPGDYTYIDSLKTEYGCDSVWTLHLRVDSTYLFNDTMSMCDDEYVVWENRLYVGSKCTDTNLPVCGAVINVQPQWDYRDTVRTLSQPVQVVIAFKLYL